MKLSELMEVPLKEALDGMAVAKITPIANDTGDIIKVIVEYMPEDELKKGGQNKWLQKRLRRFGITTR